MFELIMNKLRYIKHLERRYEVDEVSFHFNTNIMLRF